MSTEKRQVRDICDIFPKKCIKSLLKCLPRTMFEKSADACASLPGETNENILRNSIVKSELLLKAVTLKECLSSEISVSLQSLHSLNESDKKELKNISCEANEAKSPSVELSSLKCRTKTNKYINISNTKRNKISTRIGASIVLEKLSCKPTLHRCTPTLSKKCLQATTPEKKAPLGLAVRSWHRI